VQWNLNVPRFSLYRGRITGVARDAGGGAGDHTRRPTPADAKVEVLFQEAGVMVVQPLAD